MTFDKKEISSIGFLPLVHEVLNSDKSTLPSTRELTENGRPTPDTALNDYKISLSEKENDTSTS